MVLIPFGYVAAAFVVGWRAANPGTEWFGARLSPMSSSSAVALLSALASGMIAFTGIVFSLMFVGLQFGSSTYGPRVVQELGRNRLLPHSIGVYTGTFLYALLAVRTVDIEGSSGINAPVAAIALAWLLASVTVSVLVLPQVATLSLGRVLTLLQRRGRQAVRSLYRRRDAEPREAELPRDLPVTQVVVHHGDPLHLVGLDDDALVKLAASVGGVIDVPRAVGDVIIPGEPLLRVLGARAPLPEKPLRNAVWLSTERFTDNDPAYALRLLADIAIRALSPAINDPTTAVDVLDRIQALLFDLGRCVLGAGRQVDRAGVVRLSFSIPSWEALVDLALGEIAQYARDAKPVQQRIKSLVDSLLEALPAERRHMLRGVG
jgi:uncharacterized membrane protein